MWIYPADDGRQRPDRQREPPAGRGDGGGSSSHTDPKVVSEGRGAAAQKGAAFGMAAEGEDEFYLRY